MLLAPAAPRYACRMAVLRVKESESTVRAQRFRLRGPRRLALAGHSGSRCGTTRYPRSVVVVQTVGSVGNSLARKGGSHL